MMTNRMHALGRRLTLAAVVITATLWPALEVVAQGAPPQPALRRSPPVWLGMGIMFVLFALVVALNFFPSKRSHQD